MFMVTTGELLEVRYDRRYKLHNFNFTEHFILAEKKYKILANRCQMHNSGNMIRN